MLCFISWYQLQNIYSFQCFQNFSIWFLYYWNLFILWNFQGVSILLILTVCYEWKPDEEQINVTSDDLATFWTHQNVDDITIKDLPRIKWNDQYHLMSSTLMPSFGAGALATFELLSWNSSGVNMVPTANNYCVRLISYSHAVLWQRI